MQQTTTIPVLLLLVMSLLGAPALLAEEGTTQEAAPTYLVVHTDEVYPEMVQQYEEVTREWVAAFQEAGMGPEWTWYTSTGAGFTYTVVFPFNSFAYLDNEEERGKKMAEAIGQDKVADLIKRGNQAIRAHYSEILKYDPELSYHPKVQPEAPPGFMHLSLHWVKPSKMDAYKAMVVEVRDALVKAEQQPLGWEAYQILFGEGTYGFVSQAESAAQYYQAPSVENVLVKTLGEEEAGKIFDEWRSCVTNYDSADMQPRADLSYMPKAAEASE